jgi:4-amino-4-deoxychorismate lyase
VIDTCGVEGVMRRFILEEAAKTIGVAASAAYCERAMLAGAQELFLCNAVAGVWPVRRLGSRTLQAGPVTRRVQAIVAQLFDA